MLGRYRAVPNVLLIFPLTFLVTRSAAGAGKGLHLTKETAVG